MAKPNLSNFEMLFKSGENFSITEEQYLKESGLRFPKQPYLQKDSALARMAKAYDYEIEVENIIVFCKKKEK